MTRHVAYIISVIWNNNVSRIPCTGSQRDKMGRGICLPQIIHLVRNQGNGNRVVLAFFFAVGGRIWRQFRMGNGNCSPPSGLVISVPVSSSLHFELLRTQHPHGMQVLESLILHFSSWLHFLHKFLLLQCFFAAKPIHTKKERKWCQISIVRSAEEGATDDLQNTSNKTPLG